MGQKTRHPAADDLFRDSLRRESVMAKDIAIKTKRLMLSPMNLEALEKKCF